MIRHMTMDWRIAMSNWRIALIVFGMLVVLALLFCGLVPTAGVTP